MCASRFFSLSAIYRKEALSPLASLRKKTGYSFANIRKALEIHNNDESKAEAWLKEQAKALGWSAALKVQNRRTSQGLVGIAVNSSKLAMVEVNCETDFVARNEKFKSIVELVAKTCLQEPVLTSGEDSHYICLNSEKLGKLKAGDETLADSVALLIGSLGENVCLRRAFCYETARKDVILAASVHPPCHHSTVLLGKYGSFISYFYDKESNSSHSDDLSIKVGDELCKHIIGLNPKKIGDFEVDKPCENSDDEKVLIYQEFLADESKTVGQFLKESSIKILDFKRFECGEADEENIQSENDDDTGKFIQV